LRIEAQVERHIILQWMRNSVLPESEAEPGPRYTFTINVAFRAHASPG
jgi:hypothetical protein